MNCQSRKIALGAAVGIPCVLAILFCGLYINSATNKKNKNDLQINQQLENKEIKIEYENLNYNTKTKYLEVKKPTSNRVLKGHLGLKIQNEYLKDVSVDTTGGNMRIEFVPHDTYKYTLEIQGNIKKNSNIQCDRYNWRTEGNTKRLNPIFEDCFTLNDAYWYGGAESYNQQFWPINEQLYDYRPYLSGLFGISSAVLERYWLSSNGFAIIVNQTVPLFVNMNKTNICFLASNEEPYRVDNTLNLQYDVCRNNDESSSSLRDLQLFIVNNYFVRPSDVPDDLMFKRPIWSTWANYKKEINENVVLDFANQILANNYTHCQLEIDDKWQTEYGDFDFDTKKFPNMKGFMQKLKDLGFRVTLWVHPFANLDAKNFYIRGLSKYWVTTPKGELPALTSWWDGLAAGILDTTNPDATAWFVSELENIRKTYGIDSFKFDAGEVQWLPKCFSLRNASIEENNPDIYSTKYSEMAAELGNMIETRTGCQTQALPIFVRMLDKDSKWDFDNGLKSVITTALVMSVLGYPFILPDMIGGNAYAALTNSSDDGFNANLTSTVYPDYELFVRWAQLTAFMPSMQFSIPPWHYDKLTDVKVNDICRKAVQTHESLVYPVLTKFAQRSVETGEPIIRPLWWIDSTDQQNLQIFDEFLVGDQILVAPIVDKGAVQRDIYLPVGNWTDGNTGVFYNGQKWLRNYQAPIEVIPYFISSK